MSVVIKTRLRTGRPRNRDSILGRGKRYLFSSQCLDRLCCPHNLEPNGFIRTSPEIKRLAHEAVNSPPLIFEGK
jgi:hypothetical protein